MPGWAQRFPALGRLQATTLALRLGRALGLGGGSERQAWRPPRPVHDVAARLRADLTAVPRARYDALLAGPESDPGLHALLERGLAAGAPLDALEALAQAWPELSDLDRAQVADPLQPRPGTRALFLGDAPARQTDQTTCGSTVLAMLAAAGDPLLALWLVTARSPAGYLPREVRALSQADRAAPSPAARFRAVQLTMKSLSNRAALGPLPWPPALGTPPWGAARVARQPGATFSSVMIDDTDAPGFAALLDRAERSLGSGVPVPFFTGGDLGTGLTTAMPRHVVLLVALGERGANGPGYVVFDPASGELHDVTRAQLLAPAGALPALGGWSHVCWAVLPES